LNRLQGISSSPASFSLKYAYNLANQRIAHTNADASVWNYGYDSLGQIISANKTWQNGQPTAGQQFQFGYDTIGNRAYTKTGGNASGTGLHQANYNVNTLNQYISRDITDFTSTSGNVRSNTFVWVNGVAPTLQGDYFWQEFWVNNGLAGVITNLEIITVDDVSTNVVNEPSFVPQTPETFSYDLDGNLVQDAQWKYQWDAEDRLVGMQNLSVVPSPLTIGYNYDFLGRRISKTVMQDGALVSNEQFYYDGVNLIAEQDLVTGISITYNWGLDVSQSRQGADGVGGLISISILNGSYSGTYVYQYDGNGNVIGLIDATDGSTAAHYEYGPFGELLTITGRMAYLNHFRFSSKYEDDETGLSHFGLRYYQASTAHWLNPDPLEEQGGLNLYAFVGNDPNDFVDPDGLSLYAFDGTDNDQEKDFKKKEETNVAILASLYKVKGVDIAIYKNGVGTRDGIRNKLGEINGLGFQARVTDMFSRFEIQRQAGDCQVNITGFSRGAAEARQFANSIKNKYPDMHINWLGLFDTVESVGLPATDTAGYQMNIPDTVQRAFQIVAADEHRRWFPLTSMKNSANSPLNPDFAEVYMKGAHSDIGGGYGEHRGLANAALHRMWQDGIDHQVPFLPIPQQYQESDDKNIKVHDSRYWWFDVPLDWTTGRGWLRSDRPRTIIYSH